MSVDIRDATEQARDHVVQFYSRDDELVDTVGPYLAQGVVNGDVTLVVATEDHRRAFAEAMAAAGIDVAQAEADGLLVMLDASDTMARFLVDDGPDPALFDDVIGSLIRRSSATGRPVRAYGEMVALLWEAGHVPAAIDLECLWNDLGREVAFSLFCAYRSASLEGDDHADAFHDVCRLHSDVIAAAPEATQAFSHGLEAPREARQFVAETCAEWGLEAVVDDIAIVAGELAANAVLHARSDFTVSLIARSDCVRIAVSDASRFAPVEHHPETAGWCGRGLRLVGGIAARWGTDVTDDGKVVWAEIRR